MNTFDVMDGLRDRLSKQAREVDNIVAAVATVPDELWALVPPPSFGVPGWLTWNHLGDGGGEEKTAAIVQERTAGGVFVCLYKRDGERDLDFDETHFWGSMEEAILRIAEHLTRPPRLAASQLPEDGLFTSEVA